MTSGSSNTSTVPAMTKAVLCVGLSLLLLIETFALWGGLPLTTVGQTDISGILFVWTTPYSLTMAAVFIGAANLSSRLRFGHLRLYAVFACLIMLLGAAILVFLVILTGAVTGTVSWLMTASAILIAAGSSVLLICWLLVFARLAYEVAIRTVLLALLLSSVGYLIFCNLSGVLLLSLFPLLVCLAGLGLVTARHLLTKLIGQHQPEVATQPAAFLSVENDRQRSRQQGRQGGRQQSRRQGAGSELGPLAIVRLIREPLFCVTAIMFTIVITRTEALSHLPEPELLNIWGNIGIIITVIVSYLVRYGLVNRLRAVQAFSILHFYRVLFPVLATVLVLQPLFGSQLSLLVASLVFVCYAVTSALILPACLTLARQDGTEPVAVFGIFMGTVHLASVVATALAVLLYQADFFGAATLTVGILLSLYVLAMAYSVAAKAWRRREHNDDPGTVSDDPGTDGEAGSGQSAPGLADYAAQGGQAVVQGGRDAAQAGQTARAGQVAQAGRDAAQAGQVDITAKACQSLASEHQLTEREVDVLLLLAQGRDVPNIAQKLLISENTVRTHTKGIYYKLGVHSRQQLLDYVDGVKEP